MAPYLLLHLNGSSPHCCSVFLLLHLLWYVLINKMHYLVKERCRWAYGSHLLKRWNINITWDWTSHFFETPWLISNLMHKICIFFIYNTFFNILYMFRASPCSSSGGLRRNRIYAASGIVTLCRWLSCAPVKSSLLTGAQDSHLQRVTLHLLKSSTRFEHHPAHLQEVYVVIVYMQPLVSSLSAGDCLAHRLRVLS